MGNFTLAPTVFQCLSTRRKSRGNSVTGSSISSGYGPTSSCSSVATSTSSVASTESTSSHRKLINKKDGKSRSSTKVYKSSPFTGPNVFTKAENGGYSSSAADRAALQAYRFAGR